MGNYAHPDRYNCREIFDFVLQCSFLFYKRKICILSKAGYSDYLKSAKTNSGSVQVYSLHNTKYPNKLDIRTFWIKSFVFSGSAGQDYPKDLI